MAPARICICGCGREIAATARPHKLTFDNACRKRVSRAAGPVNELPAEFQHEPDVVAEVWQRKLTPEDAILWVVHPDAMRARYPHQVAA